MKMHHDHVAIITSDPERLRAWYAEKLGFELLQEWTVEAMPGIALSYIGRDGFKLEIIGALPDSRTDADRENPIANLAAGYNHFGIRVEDIEVVMEDVQEKGVTVLMPLTKVPQASIIGAMIMDIDGNLVEFIQKL